MIKYIELENENYINRNGIIYTLLFSKSETIQNKRLTVKIMQNLRGRVIPRWLLC